MNVTIGKRIRSLREKWKLSQADLAEALHYGSDSQISKIENGKKNISVEELEEIRIYFNVPIEYLWGASYCENIVSTTDIEEKLKEEQCAINAKLITAIDRFSSELKSSIGDIL